MKNKNEIPRMQLCVGNDYLRPAMKGIYIENGYAIATNGHVILKARVDQYISDLKYANGKILKKEVWDFITHSKTQLICCYQDYIQIIHKGVLMKLPYDQCVIHEKYPDYQNVFDEFEISKENLKKINHISVRFHYLEYVRLAMKESCDAFRCFFFGELKGIVCYSEHFDGVAVVMPTLTPFIGVDKEFRFDIEEVKHINELLINKPYNED